MSPITRNNSAINSSPIIIFIVSRNTRKTRFGKSGNYRKYIFSMLKYFWYLVKSQKYLIFINIFNFLLKKYFSKKEFHDLKFQSSGRIEQLFSYISRSSWVLYYCFLYWKLLLYSLKLLYMYSNTFIKTIIVNLHSLFDCSIDSDIYIYIKYLVIDYTSHFIKLTIIACRFN